MPPNRNFFRLLSIVEPPSCLNDSGMCDWTNGPRGVEKEKKRKRLFCVSTYLSKVPNQTEGVSRPDHYNGPSFDTQHGNRSIEKPKFGRDPRLDIMTSLKLSCWKIFQEDAPLARELRKRGVLSSACWTPTSFWRTVRPCPAFLFISDQKRLR